jgi:hypothetical protein
MPSKITYKSLVEELTEKKSWKIDPKRAQRALRMLTDWKPGTMVMLAQKDEMNNPVSNEANLWIVRSSNGGWYYVRPDKHTCTCQDYKRGNICKHRLAVYLYTQQIERTRAQVIAEAKKMAKDGKFSDLLLSDLGY